ncbi:MAG: transcriptional regulator [Oscillospiraceae bacterium]|nr:transcriptional regulator [Oscillospiraceae bacterium]
MAQKETLVMLTQLAKGVARQFGPSCEVVVHSLCDNDIESSIVAIENGEVTSRKVGDGPSHVVLEALSHEGKGEDHLAYLTKTRDGKILKSSTMFIRDDTGRAQYIFAINYDITGMLIAQSGIEALISTDEASDAKEPERIVQSVGELLEELIDNAVALVGKPVALMTKDDKIRAIQFLNKAGAFLITKSGDKVSKYFGISKYTLYSYIDSK